MVWYFLSTGKRLVNWEFFTQPNISVREEGEVEILLDEGKVRGFVASRPAKNNCFGKVFRQKGNDTRRKPGASVIKEE